MSVKMERAIVSIGKSGTGADGGHGQRFGRQRPPRVALGNPAVDETAAVDRPPGKDQVMLSALARALRERAGSLGKPHDGAGAPKPIITLEV